MLTLHCTKILIRSLGLKSLLPPPALIEDSLLGGWYANLFSTGRDDALIFVNEKTHFNFIVTKIRRAHIDAIGQILINGIKYALEQEKFSQSEIATALTGYDAILLTKTVNKGTLASMSNLSNLYQLRIEHTGGIGRADIKEIVIDVNSRPDSALNWDSPIERLRKLVNERKPDLS
jgi:hypothetical protein